MTNKFSPEKDLVLLITTFINKRGIISNRYPIHTFTPPNGKYQNYIFPSNYVGKVAPYISTTNPSPSYFDGVEKAQDDNLSISNVTYHPYVPSLGDSCMKTTENIPGSGITGRTAGVDCNGFVQGSHGYDGSFYSALADANTRLPPVYWGGRGRLILCNV